MRTRSLPVHASLLASIGLLASATSTLAHAGEDHLARGNRGEGWIGTIAILVTVALVFLLTRREASRHAEPDADDFSKRERPGDGQSSQRPLSLFDHDPR